VLLLAIAESRGADALMSINETLYQFTEWLRTTQIVEFSLWVSDQPLSLWLQTHFWAIPGLQSIHILAIGALFGSALMLNLRILGKVGMSRTIDQTLLRYVPWIRWAFVTLVVTGILLGVAEPVRDFINPIYWIKIALIVLAVVVNLLFLAALRRNKEQIQATGTVSSALRFGAWGTTILWCLIMAGGRWIAYAPV
jgi:hypothetical protein